MAKSWFQKRYIPNYLTIFRILLVPVVITLMLVQFGPQIYQYHFDGAPITLRLNLLLAVLCFAIASITDFLDGFLARHYHWVSDFGKFWDPLADKILVNATLFAFSAPQLAYIPVWIPIVLLTRDLVVDGLRVVAAKQNIVMAANWPGKIKTVVLMVATIFVFFIGAPQANIAPVYFWAIQNILFLIALVLAIASGLIYFQLYYRQKVTSKPQTPLATTDRKKIPNEGEEPTAKEGTPKVDSPVTQEE